MHKSDEDAFLAKGAYPKGNVMSEGWPAFYYDEEKGIFKEYKSEKKPQEKEMTIDFKPCPICGASLSINDVRFFGDEGEEYCGASEPFVRCVVLGCDCGYAFSAEIERLYEEEEDLYEGGRWEENFAKLANRRL